MSFANAYSSISEDQARELSEIQRLLLRAEGLNAVEQEEQVSLSLKRIESLLSALKEQHWLEAACLPAAFKQRVFSIRNSLIQYVQRLESRTCAGLLRKSAATNSYINNVSAHVFKEARAAGLDKESFLAFVGSGSYPQSAISLAEVLKTTVSCIDNDPGAVAESKKLIASLDCRSRMEVLLADGGSFDYSPYSHVFVASLVSKKPAVLQQILRSAPRDVKVILRFGNGVKQLFNYCLQGVPSREWEILDVLSAPSALYDTVIMQKKEGSLSSASGMQFICSRLTPDHASKARALCLDVINEIYGFSYSKLWASDLDNLASSSDVYQEDARAAFFVALSNETLVSAAAVRCINSDARVFGPMAQARYGNGQDVAMITRAYTRADFRCNGAGLALINLVEDFSRQQNYKKIYLHTHRNAHFDAVGFWSRRGYTVFLEEGDADQTVHMEKRL